MGIIEPKKYVSNYSVDAAGWTQVLYRILVEGMLTNSSYGGRSGGGLADADGQIGRESREEARWCCDVEESGEGGRNSCRDRSGLWTDLSLNPDWVSFCLCDLGQFTFPCSLPVSQLLHSQMETGVSFLQGHYVCISLKTVVNVYKVFNLEILHRGYKKRKPLSPGARIKA